MKILGIHDDHNATACLMVDGKVIACASEERFLRKKNFNGYPKHAVDYCLNSTNTSFDEVDKIVFGTKVLGMRHQDLKVTADFSIKDYIHEQKHYFYPLLVEGKDPSQVIRDYYKSMGKEFVSYDIQAKRISRALEHLGKKAEEKLEFIDHHTCHAYYAYFGSPYRDKDTLILTMDSWGDEANATIFVAKDNKLTEIFRTKNCNIGRIYRLTTLMLGMKPIEHEYKVMGLAPYATDYYTKGPYHIYSETLYVDGLDFKYHHQPKDHFFYFKDKFEIYRFDGIAGALQQYTEDLICEWVRNAIEKTGIRRLVFSGGVAMNIKACKAISEIPEVSKLFVCGSAADESTAIGAAFFKCNGEPLKNLYFGPEFSTNQVLEAINKQGADERYKVMRGITNKDIVDFLIKGKVIGRCVGRMEFGARALGNRSILADPSNPRIVEVINNQIKYRDFWMPFTPTILYERCNDYLVNPNKLDSPFMTLGFDSTELAKKELPAAMHPADKTIRPQMLKREDNPDYYDLIKLFENRTGIGAILNTSLNLHGEPIVCTPEDAIHTMDNSELDGMYFGEVLLLRK